MPQFIIHIYLYLLRFPYNVWLFVAKNLSLLSSLNKKEQINTRRDVIGTSSRRIIGRMRVLVRFRVSVVFHPNWYPLVENFETEASLRCQPQKLFLATREPPSSTVRRFAISRLLPSIESRVLSAQLDIARIAISIDRAATWTKYTAREERFNRLEYVSLCHAKFRSRVRPFYANSK